MERTKRLDKVIKYLGKELKVEKDQHGSCVWDIITAFRGPDRGWVARNIKEQITMRIRQAVYGENNKNPAIPTWKIRSVKKAMPDVLKEAMEWYKEGETSYTHFMGHARWAADALNLRSVIMILNRIERERRKFLEEKKKR